MNKHGIEFFCGCMSGWAQVITMKPFEIIKVRLANQSLRNPVYNGITDCFRQIYYSEFRPFTRELYRRCSELALKWRFSSEPMSWSKK